MVISEYTPEQVCAGLGLCDKGFDNYGNDADNDILSNDIPAMKYDDDSSEDSSEELVENSLDLCKMQKKYDSSCYDYKKSHVVK